jgi:5-methylcytosine-specific restriction protein A
MNRNDEVEVKSIIGSLHPQEEKRKLCLKMFAEAINQANSRGSDKWGTYYRPDKVRLLVGNLIVFTIESECVWLALDKQLLESSEKYQHLLKESNSWQWDKVDYPAYSQVPSKNGYFIPSEDHLEIWPVIRSLHFEFIDKVATKYEQLKKTSQAKHNSAVVSYLRNELGQLVPAPVYEQIEIEDNFVLPEEVLDEVSFYEGGKQRITINAYERNPQARRACIAYYGTRCQICEVDLGEKYGEVGRGFIHVHHLKPLSNIGEKYEIDPIQDLVPVCPNCHAIIHKGSPPYTIEEVKKFLRGANDPSK